MDVHRGSEKAKATLIDIIKAYLYRNGEYDPEKRTPFLRQYATDLTETLPDLL